SWHPCFLPHRKEETTMRFWEGKNLRKNLETLSKLKVGEKIGFDWINCLLERHGFAQGLFRAISGDSLLDENDLYRKTLVRIFQRAAEAKRQGWIGLGLLEAAQAGLKTQVQTYAGKESDVKKWGRKDAYQVRINS